MAGGKVVGQQPGPAYSENPLVAVTLLRRFWEWGKEGVRAVLKLLCIRAKPAGKVG